MTVRVCVVIRLVPGPVSRLQSLETVGISVRCFSITYPDLYLILYYQPTKSNSLQLII